MGGDLGYRLLNIFKTSRAGGKANAVGGRADQRERRTVARKRGAMRVAWIVLLGLCLSSPAAGAAAGVGPPAVGAGRHRGREAGNVDSRGGGQSCGVAGGCPRPQGRRPRCQAAEPGSPGGGRRARDAPRRGGGPGLPAVDRVHLAPGHRRWRGALQPAAALRGRPEGLGVVRAAGGAVLPGGAGAAGGGTEGDRGRPSRDGAPGMPCGPSSRSTPGGAGESVSRAT